MPTATIFPLSPAFFAYLEGFVIIFGLLVLNWLAYEAARCFIGAWREQWKLNHPTPPPICDRHCEEMPVQQPTHLVPECTHSQFECLHLQPELHRCIGQSFYDTLYRDMQPDLSFTPAPADNKNSGR